MATMKVWDGATWQTVSSQGKPGSNVFVGPSAPPGTPNGGDLWYDTDEAPGLTLPITLANGGTGGTDSATARTALAVSGVGNSTSVTGAPPTGTWARGDQWLDSANVVWTCTVAGTPGTWMPPIGYELAYNQTTSSVTLTSTNVSAQQTVVAGTTRSYDGSPIIVEFYSPRIDSPTNTQTLIHLFDGATNLGYITLSLVSSGSSGFAQFARQRIVPTSGSHTYSVTGWVTSGTGTVCAGPGPGSFSPAYLRITRA